MLLLISPSPARISVLSAPNLITVPPLSPDNHLACLRARIKPPCSAGYGPVHSKTEHLYPPVNHYPTNTYQENYLYHTVDNGALNNRSQHFFFRSTGPAIMTHLLQQFHFRKTYHLQKHPSAVLCSNAAVRRHYKNHRNKRKNEEDETDTVTAFTLLSHGENNHQKLLLQRSLQNTLRVRS